MRNGVRLVVCALLAVSFSGHGSGLAAAGQEPDPADASLREFAYQLEQIFMRADPTEYLGLLTGSASGSSAREFMATEMIPGATRVVIKERERQEFLEVPKGTGYRMRVDAFFQYGDRARVSSWILDVTRTPDGPWRILDQKRDSSIENLYRLTLTSAMQYDAKNFTITAEDLDLTLEEGTAFTIDTDQGTTGLVLLGKGEMRFHPTPETEKQQVKIFAGAETLDAQFDTAFLRVGDFESHASKAQLTPRPVDPRDLRRAEKIFREESVKSFSLDLADLTPDNWSILPGARDFLGEIHTRRFDTLTYTRSESEAEDVSVFNRATEKNISIYMSAERLATRGRFYSEDDQTAYDVLDYDIDVAIEPERTWVEGRVRLHLRWQRTGGGQLTLRLANPLVVQSIISDRFGRLFNVRLKNQDAVIVNLPTSPTPGDELTLTITYSGLLPPQDPERETLMLGQASSRDYSQDVSPTESFWLRPEPSFLYSNRSYWYPQATVSDYATARIRITVPSQYDCVATGILSPDWPKLSGDPPNLLKTYEFRATRPARYLSMLVSHFVHIEQVKIVLADAPESNPPIPPQTLDLTVIANPRQVSRVQSIADKAAEIATFYRSLMGDAPYEGFTAAMVESQLPGGHSPAYFAQVNVAVPMTSLNWRGDPAAFPSFPDFFLAHEMAHQWWGQAIGWQNYHEQWLSEGFSQYFAALYAQHSRGNGVFETVLRQMRRWAIDRSDQGPIYLGYRLGHVKEEGRIFRAIVYNKGAVVLHILRQLVGDGAFFRGLRRFYTESKFTKTGTDEFRRAMEAESGRPLQTFFERWIYASSLPRLTFRYQVEGQELVLKVDQVGDVFDVPVTVTVRYANGKSTDVVMPVADKSVEMRLPLAGTLRGVEISRNDLSLASIKTLP